MIRPSVLIVEDDFLVALGVERELTWAGYDVCGVASSEAEALALAEKCRPALAVIDISLDPGDGRQVARVLSRRYETAVLFATGQCSEVQELTGTGAKACLPKPYDAAEVADALVAVARLNRGERASLPGRVFAVA